MAKKKNKNHIILICVCLVIAVFIGILIAKKLSNKEDTGEIYCKEIDEEHVATDTSGMQYMDNEILIVAAEGTKKKDIEKIAKKYNAKIVGWIEKTGDFQLELEGTYYLDELEDLCRDLEKEEKISSADFNGVFTIAQESADYDVDYGDEWREDLEDKDDVEGKSWGAEAINAPDAWEFMNQNKEIVKPVRVGLIDVGFDTDHEDLGFVDTFYNGNTDTKHGTEVAGIMAAKSNNSLGICGIYPYGDGNLYGASWANETYGENQVHAMKEKCILAELILRNVKVINCSYSFVDYNLFFDYWDPGTTQTAWIEDLENTANTLGDFLNRCLEKGYDFVIVSTAGNQSNKVFKLVLNKKSKYVHTSRVDAKYSSVYNAISSEKYPDVCNRIIIVGNVGKSYEIAMTSNSGADIYAPGELIYCTQPNNSYGTDSGTSMSAPHVSGVAAMVWSLNNQLTGADVKEIIRKSISNKSEDAYPVIDAYAAVKSAYDTIDDPSQPVVEALNGGVLCFVVDAEDTSIKISNATVTATPKEEGRKTESTTTDADGHFELILVEGEYTLTVTHEDYEDYVTDITVTKEGVNYLDDWIKMEQKAGQEEILQKYEEVLRYIDENGILPECEDAASYQPYFSYEGFEASQSYYADGYEGTVYAAENSDFYFAIQDIDGDGTQELLVEWYNWYDFDYGGSYTVILQYHPEQDTLNCEAVIPISQFAYETNNTRHQATFYDNGLVNAELEWINAGQGAYLCQYEYNAESDTYTTTCKDWMSYGSPDFPDVIDVWDKTEYPEIDLIGEDELDMSFVGTQKFPDELDVDGDGKIYCKMGTEHLYDVTVNFDFSQFKDIQDIEELNIPKGENHEIPITWSHIHTYVQTGEKSEGKKSMKAVYGRLASDYFSENYNDWNLTDEEKNHIFYALSDLNDDGTDELICGIYYSYESDGTVETEYEKLRIYTFQNGKAYLIVCDDDENWPEYQICENGIRYMAGRGSGYRCYEFYQFSDSTKLEAVETVFFDSPDSDTLNYYYNMGGMDSGNTQEISEDEYNAHLNAYPKKELALCNMSTDLAYLLSENGIQ